MVKFEDLGAPFVKSCQITACISPTQPILINTALAEPLDIAIHQIIQSLNPSLNPSLNHTSDFHTVASVYSGHQFGQWAGQLGDGRALLLKTVHDLDGNPQEIQLKGAGPTPYSRGGDGRAVLRSSIREFLGSEAMFALGIPTTRALALFGSNDVVWRETAETAAIVARTAPTFVRFGHFEHFHDQPNDLQTLFEWCAEHHFPAMAEDKNRIIEQIVVRTADMVAQWQAVGFCHGVMNTDNFSILGLTLDYGPFGFLEKFDPNFICNHSDHSGRYAYARQPEIAYWNVSRLLLVLLPTLNLSDQFEYFLHLFAENYHRIYTNIMAKKLGLISAENPETHANHESIQALINAWLQLLYRQRVDYTRANRALLFFESNMLDKKNITIPEILAREFADQASLATFLITYQNYLHNQNISDNVRQTQMAQHNPAFVLRNWIAQAAIDSAEKQDYALLHEIDALFKNPYLSPEQAIPTLRINGEMIPLNADAPTCFGELCVSCSS